MLYYTHRQKLINLTTSPIQQFQSHQFPNFHSHNSNFHLREEPTMEITKDIVYLGVNDHAVDLFEGEYESEYAMRVMNIHK